MALSAPGKSGDQVFAELRALVAERDRSVGRNDRGRSPQTKVHPWERDRRIREASREANGTDSRNVHFK
eukprot:15470238-Alexandrium_andersonii.AAC.1